LILKEPIPPFVAERVHDKIVLTQEEIAREVVKERRRGLPPKLMSFG